MSPNSWDRGQSLSSSVVALWCGRWLLARLVGCLKESMGSQVRKGKEGVRDCEVGTGPRPPGSSGRQGGWWVSVPSRVSPLYSQANTATVGLGCNW